MKRIEQGEKLKRRYRILKYLIPVISLMLFLTSCTKKEQEEVVTEEPVIEQIDIQTEQDESPALLVIEKITSMPDAQWMVDDTFPGRNDNVSTTLAMNSMDSFKYYSGQGHMYISVGEDITGFKLYINEKEADTSAIEPGGIYDVDLSDIALRGMNTFQISSVLPYDAETKVRVCIPYPEIVNATPKEAGINADTLSLIEDIVKTDIEYGFTSAQMAVIRDGKLIYENAWGKVNSYLPDGSRNTASPDVTTDTLYDLASVTKMFSTNYAVQKLVTDGELDLDSRITEYLGEGFVTETLDVRIDKYERFDPDTQKRWKSKLTVRDILKHQAGFAPSVGYCKPEKKELFSGNDSSEETKQATLLSICKTPLVYEPGTQTMYSDLDFMILGFIVENITGKDLDTYLKDTFAGPMGLSHMTYRPLDNGYSRDDCAATELNGNTRDGTIFFDGIRTDTIQGEVHDELAYYSMAGISGHAGLFSNATDLAKLASVMLTGGYGTNRYFSDDVMDMFTAPKSEKDPNWGLGWWREADHMRTWYFGTQSSSRSFGHQGWTGTLVIIDPERDLVIAYLTNKVNSPLINPKKNPNSFAGSSYTSSTLGFTSQILSIGMDSDEDITGQLMSLLESMVCDSFKLVDQSVMNDESDPRVRNVLSKLAVYKKRAEALSDESYIEKSGELCNRWEQIKKEQAVENEEEEPESEEVILGDERFDEYLPLLEGKKVALFTNHTGIVGDDLNKNEHILDALIDRNINVTAVFSPEHGFRGDADAGASISDSTDEKTGTPILSLYDGKSHYPSKESLEKFDTLVVDMQDVGLRYYTYYISLWYLMDACAEHDKNVIILDRPNPNGFYVDGPVLKSGFESNVGRLPIPVVHGMTWGELARMINGEGWLNAGKDACDLTVVGCKNYSHDIKTEIVIDPSPNIKDMRAVYLYASTCFFENTAVSVGRGTDYPFEIYGSPYLENSGSFDFSFTPQSMSGATDPPFKGQVCYGRDLRDIPLEDITQAGIDLQYLIDAYNGIKQANPDIDFFGTPDKNGHYWIDYLMGTDEVRKLIEQGKSAEEIKAYWQDDVDRFCIERKQYLLYD